MNIIELFILCVVVSWVLVQFWWAVTARFSVVRCKNCRKYDLKTQCCTFWPDEGYRAPDHYCAEGERRDGNG